MRFAFIELVDAVLENPIFVAALICFVLGFGLSGLVRILPVLALGSMVSPSVFLASYVLTYQQIPTFPPIGATNKIFYIGVAATLIGFLLDLLPQIRNYTKILVAIMSLSIVGWIGYPRFAKPDMGLMVTSLGLWLGGIALLWPLDAVAKTPTERNGGGVAGTAMLASLLLGFAPVALFGGSSTSMMLCLAAVAGLAAVVLWELVIPRQAFGASAIFGVGGGLLAMINTVTLITRQVDLAALALLLLIPYTGAVCARLLPLNRIRGRARQILIGTLAASPILLVMAVLLLRRPESLS